MRLNISNDPPKSAGIADQANRCAVILAGGDGTRLKSLTRAIAGDERPKQFCSILGNESLLDQTRKRVALGIAPGNIYYSLTSSHRDFYNPLFDDTVPRQLIIQPENKGTAPAILYSLMRILKTDPGAHVAFFPSDHYFSDDISFMNAVDAAFESVRYRKRSIVLLGIDPEKPETSYGWIEPYKSGSRTGKNIFTPVKRFWEKPNQESANFLMDRGCLWNSFVMVGTVDSFLKIIRRQLPNLYKSFLAASEFFGTDIERTVLSDLYSDIGEFNFSSEVLERSPEYLDVLRVANVGWSDWGEPTRVFGTLENLGVTPGWMKTATV